MPSACVSYRNMGASCNVTVTERWRAEQGEVFVFNGKVAPTERGSQSTVEAPAVICSGNKT